MQDDAKAGDWVLEVPRGTEAHSEEAVRESEEPFRQLVEHLADAFLVVDRGGRIVDANQRAFEQWGYTREELLSLTVPDIDIDYDPARVASVLDRVIAAGSPITIDGTGQRKDGTTFPMEIRVAVIERGGHPHIYALVRDVSERSQAEAAQRDLAVLEERNRLARELHDSVTQSLYSLTLFAEAGSRLAESGNWEQVKDYLDQLGETAQQALKEMRLLVHQLRPMVLQQEGLVGALQQRLEAVEKRAGVDARLLVDLTIDLPITLEEELYRISQEALNNVLKHAGATSVTVRIDTDGGRVDLEVEDNGRGFDPKDVRETGGMGLSSMRERVEALGGSLTIFSVAGQGTKVKVSVDSPAST